MSDRQLRSDLIRLAAASTPEVRKALLPLLSKKAAGAKTAGKLDPKGVWDKFGKASDTLDALVEALEDFGDDELVNQLHVAMETFGEVMAEFEANYIDND